MLVQAIIALLFFASTAAQPAILERQCGDWNTDAAPLIYQGTDLYTFMDGGAEIYLEYGFERLESQIYQRGNDEITVELYRMGDGAYGMFTFLRPAECNKIELGQAAFLTGYYLVFVKGPFLCALTARDEFPGFRDALIELAGSIASRLEGVAKPPASLSLLPAAGRVDGTEKQLRGPVGLRNSSVQASELFTGFSDGAIARYGTGCLAGFLRWKDQSQADQAWEQALARSPKATVEPRAGVLSLIDGKFLAKRVGVYVVFAEGEDQRKTGGLLHGLESSVKTGSPISEKGGTE